MSNVVPFPPLARSKVAPPGRHLAARFLEHPPAHSHAVQFYDDHAFLVETVAQFLLPGLDAGQSVLVVATAPHTDALIERLGKARVTAALRAKQLLLVDSDAMLARFMLAGEVSEPAFANALELVLRELPAAAAGGPLRAFGEMVDALWQQGQTAAALKLEELWCRICEQRKQLTVLCAYRMGNFYKQRETPRFRQVCELHSHVLPTERFARSRSSDFERLREICLLEQRERLLESEVFYREQLENVLRERSGNAGCRAAEGGAFEGGASGSAEPSVLADGRARPAGPASTPAASLQAAAHALLEPSAELVAVARGLLRRLASSEHEAEALARLEAASERLQHALAQLHRASIPPTVLSRES